ncbi:uncharacterized protein BT62DRAFT_1008301 [Guyanagaster necrorhizus]|uniref:Uncharacterized protein n=1 Tax=Guyanagaster necrorhizus TaxID=856835 RepID=A0A9P7VP37_9AGAR|nr:uncharacterized protein BT62DRAFT_1008301 [Guyanagaster necrorhizus MCA 3950]KAG7444098.1 hypothetical protein BT62DRAFT_1008301 [Guyanagaster necrorhizus MCA 3950]
MRELRRHHEVYYTVLKEALIALTPTAIIKGFREKIDKERSINPRIVIVRTQKPRYKIIGVTTESKSSLERILNPSILQEPSNKPGSTRVHVRSQDLTTIPFESECHYPVWVYTRTGVSDGNDHGRVQRLYSCTGAVRSWTLYSIETSRKDHTAKTHLGYIGVTL